MLRRETVILLCAVFSLLPGENCFAQRCSYGADAGISKNIIKDSKGWHIGGSFAVGGYTAIGNDNRIGLSLGFTYLGVNIDGWKDIDTIAPIYPGYTIKRNIGGSLKLYSILPNLRIFKEINSDNRFVFQFGLGITCRVDKRYIQAWADQTQYVNDFYKKVQWGPLFSFGAGLLRKKNHRYDFLIIPILDTIFNLVEIEQYYILSLRLGIMLK